VRCEAFRRCRQVVEARSSQAPLFLSPVWHVLEAAPC